MNKDRTFNAFAMRAEFVGVEADEIVIDLILRRKAPKGSSHSLSDTRTRIRLTMHPGLVNQLAEVGAQGLRKLVQEAEAAVRGRQGYIERLQRIAGAA